MDQLSSISPGLTALISRKALDTESVNGNPESDTRKAELKEVAKEMESLFAYQLIKTMRETAKSMASEEKGLGSSTYMSLFDMEVSKLFADKGLGLQDAIVNLMERMPDSSNSNKNMNNDE